MGLLSRVRDLTRSPERRLLDDLSAAHDETLRLGKQLRLHAESVPYPYLVETLHRFADRQDAHAALVREEIADLGGTVAPEAAGVPRQGRNYWQRLTIDLEDFRTKAKRHLEQDQHWNLDHPRAAALFARLAHEDAGICQALRELIARSDPHAED